MSTAYIVPSTLLSPTCPASEWHATSTPSDPSQSLVVVDWTNNPNAQTVFESLPGVLALGHPWEPLPDLASPLLASFESTPTTLIDAPMSLTPVTPDTVAMALRKVSWPGAKMVR